MTRFIHHCIYGDIVEIYINDHEDVVVTISYDDAGFVGLLTREDAKAVAKALAIVVGEAS